MVAPSCAAADVLMHRPDVAGHAESKPLLLPLLPLLTLLLLLLLQLLLLLLLLLSFTLLVLLLLLLLPREGFCRRAVWAPGGTQPISAAHACRVQFAMSAAR